MNDYVLAKSQKLNAVLIHKLRKKKKHLIYPTLGYEDFFFAYKIVSRGKNKKGVTILYKLFDKQ